MPLSSALAVNALLRQRGTQVTSQIIKGENAQHSQLHENPEVDQLLIEFLWPSKGTCSIKMEHVPFSILWLAK